MTNLLPEQPELGHSVWLLSLAQILIVVIMSVITYQKQSMMIRTASELKCNWCILIGVFTTYDQIPVIILQHFVPFFLVL